MNFKKGDLVKVDPKIAGEQPHWEMTEFTIGIVSAVCAYPDGTADYTVFWFDDHAESIFYASELQLVQRAE